MRSRLPLSRNITRGIFLIPACAIFFLLILAFGNPPLALGLDPAWTEVLAWGFLHNAQWGRDLVFSYGPLGFLHPYSSYVSGIFPWFVAGEIALPAVFVLTVALMLWNSGVPRFGLFALVYIFSFSRLNGDLCWELTLVFGTTCLINCLHEGGSRKFLLVAVLLSPAFGAIALIKFSFLPLWIASVAALSAICVMQRRYRQAALVLVIFALGLIALWLLCGQQLPNLPRYLSMGLEVAYGYGHAMGVRAPFAAETGAMAAVVFLVASAIFSARHTGLSGAAVVSICLSAVFAALFWLASFIRGDEYHWPGFFVAMTLLPFALLCNRYLDSSRARSTGLILVIVACASVNIFMSHPSTIPERLLLVLQDNLHTLGHLPELQEKRENEWKAVANSADLPRIRNRVGKARIDMVTWQQGMILLNGLNYAPRPVFQSYFAYTPTLARLNEAYFLGSDAPDFVLFRLDYSDGRVPASEDGLALIALLKRYRLVLVEKGFLLLGRDESTKHIDAVIASEKSTSAMLGKDVPIHAGDEPAIGFIRINLNPFGRLYTSLFREPELSVVTKTSDGAETRHRLIRLTAASGFLLTPAVQSSLDWIKLYLSRPLPKPLSIRVDAESEWSRLLYQTEFTVALQPTAVLHPDPDHESPDFDNLLYPGFNVAPSAPLSLRMIDEDGYEAAFLHAPDSITFKPESGNYAIKATFGIQSAASNDAGCAASDADGVGVSVVIHHAGDQTSAWHAEIDPFHAANDRGPHYLRVESVDVGDGDSVEYRVDPGHGGNNVSCDWTYVRDLVFKRRGPVGWTETRIDLLFADGFD